MDAGHTGHNPGLYLCGREHLCRKISRGYQGCEGHSDSETSKTRIRIHGTET
uniref:Uncharacterized protein n=1 Tax=Anguilla anguilla TaxID=7936 RepID=A0A0E9VDC8_ANGAN